MEHSSFIGAKAELSLESILGYILGMGMAGDQKMSRGDRKRQVEKHFGKFLKIQDFLKGVYFPENPRRGRIRQVENILGNFLKNSGVL